MFVIKRFILTLAEMLALGLSLYTWVVIIRALITWVNPDPYNPIVRFLATAVDPITNWMKRKMPFLRVGMTDFSILVLILILFFLRSFVPPTLTELAMRLN